MSGTGGGGFRGMRLDIAVGTGFVLETAVYSIYTCLFIAALPTLANAKRRQENYSRMAARMLLTFYILMYVVATLHLVFAAFRFYKSIFLSDPKGPISYLQNLSHWEGLGATSLLCIQTWLGDVLVIYRCYIVWNRNLWLISILTCLLFGQIALDITTLYFLPHLSSLPRTQAHRIRNALYPLPFAQNFITTGLIIFKLLLHHRESKKAGTMDMASTLSLIRVVRIVIESAAIYTIEILVLVILTYLRNNAQYIVQAAVPPSIGITFILLAIRIESLRHEYTRRSNTAVRNSSLLRWAHHNNSGNSSEIYGNCNSVSSGDGNVIDHKIDGKKQVGVDNIWDPESSLSAAKLQKVPLWLGGVRQ